MHGFSIYLFFFLLIILGVKRAGFVEGFKINYVSLNFDRYDFKFIMKAKREIFKVNFVRRIS